MSASRHHDEQPRCDVCNAYGDYCEAADEYRCDDCWTTEEQEEADRHDTFLRKLVDDEYWATVNAAKDLFDHEVRAASDLPTIEYMSAYGTADRKFLATVAEARAEKPIRLAQLRANDLAEAERERPRIYSQAAE